MTERVAGLLAVQLLYLAIGTGVLSLLGVARTRPALLRRIGLAYFAGVAATGVVAAHLALVDVPVGLVELAVLAAASVALAIQGLRRSSAAETRGRLVFQAPASTHVVTAAISVVLLALLVHGAAAYAVKPLNEWDGWAIWATKARALYEFGGVHELVFTSYQPVAHPILFPSLEAIAFRGMGAFDATLVHLQLIALAFGFAAAVFSLLADRVAPDLIVLGLLALLSASPVLTQLSSNLADIPLSFLVALGVVSLGRFLLAGERSMLAMGALFLGAATLTKPEGLLFAAAAFAAAATALAVGRTWRRLALLALAGLGALLILVPWRVYLVLNDLDNPEYTLSNALRPRYLADHSDRVSPATSRLWHEIWFGNWGLLIPIVLASVAGAALARRYSLALFAVLWPALGFAGLVLVYWVSVLPIELTLTWTASRVVDSLVVGSAALVPLLLGEAWPSRR